MDPQELTLDQFKKVLRQRRLPTSGRKTELVLRLQEADPTNNWINEAMQYNVDEDEREEAVAVNRLKNNIPNQDYSFNYWSNKETELAKKERDLMQREINLLRRENNLL